MVYNIDVVKFFGFELGAQVTATPSDDRYIINGAHEASKLQDYLDTFIVKFVLCEECKNPETDLKITKEGNIIRACKACGQRTNVALRHKLSGYILKNPPGKESGDPKKGSKKSKSKSKKSEDKAEKEAENGSGGNSDEDKNATPDVENDGDASDDELTRRIQQEAKELPKASQDGAKDDGWAIDMSQDAIDRRAQALADSLSRVVVAGGDEEEEEEEAGDNPYEKLGAWIEEEKKNSKGSVDDVEIYKKCVELGIEKKHKTLQVLAQTLFDEMIVKQIPTRAALLKKVCVMCLPYCG